MAKKNKHAAYNRTGVFDVVLYIIMVLFMACIIVPFLHIIAVSLSGEVPVSLNQVGLWPKDFTLDTYIKVIKNGDFIQAYGNTIYYTVIHHRIPETHCQLFHIIRIFGLVCISKAMEHKAVGDNS